MRYAFAHLPTVESLGTDEDKHIKNISYVTTARSLYDDIGEYYPEEVTQEQLNLLKALEKHYEAAGYISHYSGYNASLSKYFYGTDVESVKGSKDDTYGFVTKVNIPKNTLSGGGTAYEQALSYANDAIGEPTAEGYVLNIYPRSSLGFKHQICLANTVGIIDADYYNALNEGHIIVALVNRGDKEVTIKKGDRFVQGIIYKFYTAEEEEVTKVRTGGFGSSN